MQGLPERARGGARGRGPALAQRGARRHRPVEHEHADLGAGVAGRHGLAMRPHAEHPIGGARVELGDDGDPHRLGYQPLWTASVRCASSRGR